MRWSVLLSITSRYLICKKFFDEGSLDECKVLIETLSAYLWKHSTKFVSSKVESGKSSEFWRMMKYLDIKLCLNTQIWIEKRKSDLFDTRRSWTLNRVYSWEILDVQLKMNLNISTSKWKLAWKSLDNRSTKKLLLCSSRFLPKLTKFT